MKAKILSIAILFSVAGFSNRPLAPVPLTESSPSRISVAAEAGIHRLISGDAPAGDFGLAHLVGVFNYNYYLGSGFELGLGALGGPGSTGMLFAGGNMVGFGGLELMLRYLSAITDSFYMGLALQVDYAHDFDAANIKKVGAFDLGVSLPFSFEIGDNAAWLYVAPNFGLKGIKTADDKESGFAGLTANKAMSVLVGTYINVGGPWLVLEANPRWNNLNMLEAVDFDFALGVAFDF